MSSWLNGLMSKAVSGSSPTTTASTLIQRLQSAHSQEEKRTVIQDIKNISTDQRNFKTLGSAIPVFVNILRNDRQDGALVRPTLQILVSIMSAGRDDKLAPADSVQAANIHAFVEKPENISILLSLLEEPDKIMRFYATKLLAILVINRSDQVQQVIMQSPLNCIVDLIKADSEMIRNEGLLLLTELTKSNEELKKLVAFADGFQALFNIMSSEGMNNGGVVVQDCLQIVNNLLRGNSLTQKQFKEMGCISYLPPLLALENSDIWILTDDKQSILALALETVSLLTSPSNSDCFANQTAIGRDGALASIMKLALGGVNSPVVRAKAQWTLGDVIRGHPSNRAVLEGSKFKSDLNTPVGALTKLAQIALNSKLPRERKAALHVFRCFLHENEDGQRAIATTLLPPPVSTSNEEEPLGRMLAKELFNWEAHPGDPLRVWYAALILSFVLLGNPVVKEMVLKTPWDAPSEPGAPSQTLLQRVMKAFMMTVKTQVDAQITIGFLRLLCIWLDDSEPAIATFLQQPSHITFLVETLTRPTTNLHVGGLCALLSGLCMCSTAGGSSTQDIVLSKIGVDKFLEKLTLIRQSEDFSAAEKNSRDEEVRTPFYDYEFTIFFKKCHDKISAKVGVHSIPSAIPTVGRGSIHYDLAGIPAGLISDAEHTRIVQNYKDIIRASDARYESLKKRNDELEEQVIKLRRDLAESKAVHPMSGMTKMIEEKENYILALERRVRELEAENNELRRSANVNANVLQQQVDKLSRQLTEMESRVKEAETERDELLIFLAQLKQENDSLRQKLGLPVDS